MITCSICSVEKPDTDYYPRKKQCKPCYLALNRERWRRNGASWNCNSPAAIRKNNLRKYGLTPEKYEAMSAAQGGVCLICSMKCKTNFNLAVDHNHATGEVRGLLCANCNKGIGCFQDSPELLRRAADYLGRQIT